VPTWLKEDGEPEVGGLEGCVLRLVRQQEILGLEVPVHDPQLVALLDDPHDDSCQAGRSALAVVPLSDDAVKQLPPGAHLHDQVHVLQVLIRALLESHEVRCEYSHVLIWRFKGL
jgi:hypothetical protein